MSYQALKEYIVIIWERYNKLNKEGKTALLNEATEVTKLSRKHLIRSLNQPKEVLARKKPSGRNPKYCRELLLPVIKYLWEQMERISARRMKAAYPDWLPKCVDPRVTPQVCLMLEAMSASTLERLLAQIRGSLRATNGCKQQWTKGPELLIC